MLHYLKGDFVFKRILVILALAVSLFTPAFTLQEENPVVISRMEIDLWPDYDRPHVLVMYRIQISNETRLPVRISLRMPAKAISPYKVATRDLDGLLYNLEYSLEPQGSWYQIVMTTSSNELYIEYYDPRIVRNADERNYDFSWICDYPIERLIVKVQEPKNTTGLLISPSMGLGELNISDDLTYYSRDFGPLPTGITFNAEISYTRTSAELSASNLPVAAATPFYDNTGFSQTISKAITQVLDNRSLVVAGSLIIAGILLMLVVSFVAGSWINPFARFSKGNQKPGTLTEDLGTQIQYCPHCGKRVYPGDRYCRGCGNTT